MITLSKRNRKRSNKKPISKEIEKKVVKPNIIKRSKDSKLLTAAMLIGIFFMVLFLTTYFNYTSGTYIDGEPDELSDFYLSGPDPYYNMRLCEETLKTGMYPYSTVHDPDPMLNYPIGASGGRPPLFNMIAIFSAHVLSLFTGMNVVIALGYSMLFLPSIYGALLIFPVYGIGKELLNKKAGIIGALLIGIIPIHLGGGHGSTLGLFDHDSFVLLMTTFVVYFFLKCIRENDNIRALVYAGIAGISIACIELTWVSAQTIYMIICIFLTVNLLVGIFKSNVNVPLYARSFSMFGLVFVLTLPYMALMQHIFDFPMFTMGYSFALFALAYGIERIKLPWVITVPSLGVLAIAGVGFLYALYTKLIPYILGPISVIADLLFGSGVYGDKVSGTIAEAGIFNISRTVMSYGPALFWVAIAGFVYFSYVMIKDKIRSDYLFVGVVFVIYFWFLSVAGRFLNDLVPYIAIFGGICLWKMIDKIDYTTMMKNIKQSSGERKELKWYHITTGAAIVLVIFSPFFQTTSFILANIYFVAMVLCTISAIKILDGYDIDFTMN